MLRDRLIQLIEPAIAALGYELVLLEFSPGLQTGTLRLFIDFLYPANAVGHLRDVGLADCEKVSREVAALLDVEDPIPKAYQLEVSSPGLDRLLTKPAHYRRFAGENLRVQTLVPVGKSRKLKGQLLGLEADCLLLKIDAETLRIPLADVERARLMPDYAKELSRKSDQGEP